MKVLHIIGGGDVGGAKTHVLSLIRELSKNIDVKLVSLRPGAFSEDARKMGINVEVVKRGNIVSDIRRVIDIIREEGFDIIHSHGAKANMFSVIIRRFQEIPSITTVHSDYRLDYLQSILKRLSFGLINTVSLRFIDYYIGVSDSFKEMLVKRNFDPDLIFTVYNGIDFENELPIYDKHTFLDKFNLTGSINDDDLIVGILARLDPVKGIGTLLQAAKIVLNKHSNVKFIIAGDGKERRNLERKIASLGISENVFLIGHTNEPNEAMSFFDINILTSLSESFPYVILEGARLKRATISSNVGGISDLIENGRNGFLISPGDYGSLAEKIMTLIENKDLREGFGENLYSDARARFSLKHMCETQLSIYNRVGQLESIRKKHDYKYDVIVSGYYGYKNIGDDSMLKAIIDSLRKYKQDMRILVLSKSPFETSEEYDADSIFRFNLFKVMYYMKNSRLFINGGGSLIQDNTSTRSLFYYLGMIWLAKRLGMKVMIYANGIGPLSKKRNRDLTKKVIDHVDVVTLREELSKKVMESLDIKRPRIFITADPAMNLNSASNKEIDMAFEEEGIQKGEHLVGISVRNWKNRDRLVSVVAKVADYMIEKYGVKPVFIPMQHPFDIGVIDDIVEKMKGKAYVLRKRYDGRHIIGIMKRMEMLIGMRLHALIFAASVGVPIVGLAYDQKVEGFLQYIDLENVSSAGYVKNLEYDALKAVIDDVWHKRGNIREKLIEVAGELQKKALMDAKIAMELLDS